MRFVSISARLMIALVLAGGVTMIATVTDSQAVSKYARVTFHVRECPENTGDIFGKCHGDIVAGFDLGGCNPTGNCVEKGTGSNGNVRFGPRAGSNTFYVVDLSGYEGTYVYCSNDRTKAVLTDGQDGDGEFTITTTRGNNYTCDLYLLTAA